mmetsp:Transcript_19339/g.39696  ORF Transcript_19339/g.39696 Transcript_19339/m.39696 type:complete len:223 (-) Transcript_19339:356-1024(-)
MVPDIQSFVASGPIRQRTRPPTAKRSWGSSSSSKGGHSANSPRCHFCKTSRVGNLALSSSMVTSCAIIGSPTMPSPPASKTMATAVSIGEQSGSPQTTSCVETMACSRRSEGINSRDHLSMFLKASRRRSSASFFSFRADASGLNMVVLYCCRCCCYWVYRLLGVGTTAARIDRVVLFVFDSFCLVSFRWWATVAVLFVCLAWDRACRWLYRNDGDLEENSV